MDLARAFTDFAAAIGRAVGKPVTFALCAAAVGAWLVTGPHFGFSDTWQLVINTGTGLVTFLMVFLIQNTQNRDQAAIQTKLDELIRAGAAQNAFIGIEHLTEEEVEELRKMCAARARVGRVADIVEERVGREAERAAEQAAE